MISSQLKINSSTTYTSHRVILSISLDLSAMIRFIIFLILFIGGSGEYKSARGSGQKVPITTHSQAHALLSEYMN